MTQNLVRVMCCHDVGWQKRGKAHKSSTGHGAVLVVALQDLFSEYASLLRVVSKLAPFLDSQ